MALAATYGRTSHVSARWMSCALALLGAVGCVKTVDRLRPDASQGTPDDAARDDASTYDGSVSSIDAGLAPRDGLAQRDPDAGVCVLEALDPRWLVCFGADRDPYDTYLSPGDGGAPSWTVGQCPRIEDFIQARIDEGSCGNVPCGPLAASALDALADAGVKGDVDAGLAPACCYWVRRVCGV